MEKEAFIYFIHTKKYFIKLRGIAMFFLNFIDFNDFIFAIHLLQVVNRFHHLLDCTGTT